MKPCATAFPAVADKRILADIISNPVQQTGILGILNPPQGIRTGYPSPDISKRNRFCKHMGSQAHRMGRVRTVLSTTAFFSGQSACTGYDGNQFSLSCIFSGGINIQHPVLRWNGALNSDDPHLCGCIDLFKKKGDIDPLRSAQDDPTAFLGLIY